MYLLKFSKKVLIKLIQVILSQYIRKKSEYAKLKLNWFHRDHAPASVRSNPANVGFKNLVEKYPGSQRQPASISNI